MNYYNEHNPFAAAWLRELIKANVISPGEVDERSIEDVKPSELAGYHQCHFFAGIGVWSYALRQSGWADDRPVWTGSCPCQPFSAAGKRGGTSDERHLWPAFYHLISECRPVCVFGEQVASKDGLAWFDTVQADLEGTGYAVGSADLCAAGFGAPHIRQRLYFVGQSHSPRLQERISNRRVQRETLGTPERETAVGTGYSGTLAQSTSQQELTPTESGLHSEFGQRSYMGATGGFWARCNWIGCTDGKARPVEPGTFPLAHGTPNRVGRLRGYGNALVAPVAQGFIEAYLDVLRDES